MRLEGTPRGHRREGGAPGGAHALILHGGDARGGAEDDHD